MYIVVHRNDGRRMISYFGAERITYTAMILNTICGRITEIKGFSVPNTAKTVDTFIKTMNPKASAMPMAR